MGYNKFIICIKNFERQYNTRETIMNGVHSVAWDMIMMNRRRFYGTCRTKI